MHYSYDLYDDYKLETDPLSMARTTGYTPEKVALEEKAFQYLLGHLQNRDVHYRLTSAQKDSFVYLERF